MRRALPGLLLLLLAGCATGGNFFDTPPAALGPIATPPVDANLFLYHAYGDSITFGTGTTSNPQRYTDLLAAYQGVPLSNYAIPGYQACDVPTLEIFLRLDSPRLAQKPLYTLLIGTNDAINTGAHEIPFNLCHQASISWLGVPYENKLDSTAAAASGPWHLDTFRNYNAVTTDAAGATVRFKLQHAAAGPLYVWYRLISGNPGTFTCLIDGVPAAAVTTAPASDALGDTSAPNSLALLRLPAVAAGTHAVTFTQTSSGTSGMGIVAIGTPPDATVTQRPRMLVGLLPLEYKTGRQAALAAYDRDITANVALLANDGIDVKLFDAAKYMTGTTTDMDDHLHPNAAGHQEIFRAVQDAF